MDIKSDLVDNCSLTEHYNCWIIILTAHKCSEIRSYSNRFTRNLCIKVKNQPFFSKSLLLITTDGWIRKKQMDKKPCFYDAVLAPQVRK